MTRAGEHDEAHRDGAATIDEVEAARDRLRSRARATLGISGDEQAPPLVGGVRASGVGWYSLVAVSSLVLVSEFLSYAVSVLGPEIAGGLGYSKSAFAGAVLVGTLASMFSIAPIAALVQRRPRRATVAIVMGLACGLTTIWAGFAISIVGLAAVLAVNGVAAGSVHAVHQPLLVDTYPPAVRFRVLSAYRGAQSAGNVVGPLIVGLTYMVLNLTWRGAFVALGLVSFSAALASVRLRDPGFGRWDTDQVRAIVRSEAGAPAAGDDDLQLGFFETAQRLLLIPTIRRILVAFVVLGTLLVPYGVFLAFFLQEERGFGPAERALYTASQPVFSIVALAIVGRRGEELFQRSPARVLSLSGVAISSGVVLLGAAMFVPVMGVMVVMTGVATALFALIGPALTLAMFSVVPASMRPHLAALSGLALAAVGGFGGLMLLGGLERRFGTAVAIASLALPGVVAGLVLRTAGRTIDTDVNRMVDSILEAEEIQQLKSSGRRLPLLACRHVDFSYGQLQVLFEVDFSVDDGEMVALLGTNGAGKSTLLRVLSGLALPHNGSVRFRGADITYVDAERRVPLGIVQIPGGKAIFGSMTVADNLRVCAHSLGRRQRAESALDASFEAFPRLAERRNVAAANLSGGEQQMLALATAFILRPQVMLIDELSLGLAPKVVGELLDQVRVINARGTAVVLVEQSVNVALSIADHAYFMEKGQVRFDGPSAELLERPDLLRSVFLEGASRAFSSNSTS